MEERWKRIPSFPDYQVSDHGRVRRLTPARGTWPGRLVKSHPAGHKARYKAAVLVPSGELAKTAYVHRLVLEAFRGVPVSARGKVIWRNGDRTDNHLWNLAFVESSQPPKKPKGSCVWCGGELPKYHTKYCSEACRGIWEGYNKKPKCPVGKVGRGKSGSAEPVWGRDEEVAIWLKLAGVPVPLIARLWDVKRYSLNTIMCKHYMPRRSVSRVPWAIFRAFGLQTPPAGAGREYRENFYAENYGYR